MEYKELTQEETKILVEELCMRLPYGVHVQHMRLGMQGTLHNMCVFPIYGENDEIVRHDFTIDFFDDNEIIFDGTVFRPVLIPMSEMTDEHKKELEEIKQKYSDDAILLADNIKRFFLKNHYDDRHLLEMGLAVLSL